MDGNSPGVDINRASLDELTGLPGLKQKMAERIIAGRPYETLDDLRRVKGLPAGLLEGLRPFLSVTPAAAAAEQPVQNPAGGSPVDEPLAENPVQMSDETADVETAAEIPSVETLAETSMEVPAIEPVVVETAAVESAAEMPPVEPALEPPGELPAPMAAGETLPPLLLLAGPSTVSEPLIEVSPPEPTVSEPVAPAAEPEAPAAGAGEVQTPLEAGTAQPAEAKVARPLSNGRLIGCGALMGLAALLLSVAVTLLLLLAINGSLSFATYNQYAALGNQLQDLSSQVSGIQQDVTAMQARLSAVETLSGRVGSLETDQQALHSSLQTSQQQLEAAQTQLNQLNGQITQIQQRSQAFSQFIEGLRSLIGQIPTTQP